MKSPPTFVRRAVGTTEFDVTATAGAWPTTGGTAIRYTLLSASTSARRPSGESNTSSGTGGGGVKPGGSGTNGGGGAATRTTTLRSVPSKRIDTSPSWPAQT